MTQSLIEVRRLHLELDGRAVLAGLDLDVAAGEILGLLGPNGAGKTSTLSVLCGLLRPLSGQVLIASLDPAKDPLKVRQRLGVVPQEVALYPALTARENLVFFGRIHGLRGRLLETRVKEVLDTVGLHERASSPVRTLSGGMQRRLNLAVALLHHPAVLLLDEPTTGADVQSRAAIFEHVRDLGRQGVAVLFTTHYMDEAEQLCDRVAIMDRGRILAQDRLAGLIALLGGGVIHLSVAGPDGGLSARVLDLPEVRQVRSGPASSDGPEASPPAGQNLMLEIETHDVRQALLQVIGLMHELDRPLAGLRVLEPSLQGVFLHLTGKELGD